MIGEVNTIDKGRTRRTSSSPHIQNVMEVLIKMAEYQKATSVVTAFYKLLSVNCFTRTMKRVTTIPGPKGILAAFIWLSGKIGHCLLDVVGMALGVLQGRRFKLYFLYR